MSDVIHLLPDSIANQIAAGEVVQRPASVVKEMLENSVDAGATSVKLIVKDAGKALIQVVDNGSGMSGTDARMSFERHATSKIRSSEDLFKIRTLGFRGEAMASIAAVAQVELKTRHADDELGTQLIIESSEVKSQEPIAYNQGTSICVKNLFYNVPARRNFLKSNPVELRHINDEFQRIALANPEIAFSMVQNDLETYKLDGGKLSKRIVQLFGKNYQQQLVPCSEETELVKVTGYIGKPENAKKTRGEQFFFINNRFIKNSYLNHSVTRAYEGLLKEDYFPFYVLFIEIDPVHVDINVHPTKTEVKFDDDRMLYGVINSAVRQALASFNVTPSLDFSADVSFEHLNIQRENQTISSQKDRDYSSFKSLESNQERLDKLNELYASASQEEIATIEEAEKERVVQTTFSSSMNQPTEQEEKKPTYHLHGRYLLRQVKSGMVVLDKVSALERILFEQYQKSMKSGIGTSQSCMFPQQVNLNPSDFALTMELKSEINQLGFEFEQMSENMIVIQGIPSELAPCNEKEVFEGLIEQYKFNAEKLDLPKNESLARALAKRTAGNRCNKLKEEEMDHLMDRLFACEQPNYTPDGNPTYVLVSLEQINDWFKKG
ncbi:DNA mismatch repair protein MutL [Ekhidna lutea]|uniref:DNA mismatch repair protein MutL n=1 Tax=Ekhidna lutea TaxID=447679 RepID=A0A239IJ86_EKHLU|nr:DNA mismatch repair endonuclease MutL [Ekhidna lutea]SNS93826.1 DNA mismatch repair protein MutL [Ekhidna lutea]